MTSTYSLNNCVVVVPFTEMRKVRGKDSEVKDKKILVRQHFLISSRYL